MFRQNQRKGKRCVLVKRFILSVFAYLFAAMHGFAHAPYTCTTNNGAITITGYTGPGGNVVIPSTINSLPVTGIASNVFESLTSLTGITVPGSVSSIGEGAFAFCSGLTNATISQGVASLGQGAFYNCSSLTSILIPASVTNVGPYAFQGCTSLTNVVISNGVSNLGQYAFFDCGNLPDITIPASVTNIGQYAFQGCTDLTNVVISNGLPNLGPYSFYGSGLTSITIPGSVNNIGQAAFSLCTGLTNVSLLNGVASLGQAAFYGCGDLGSITIPASVTNIGEYAFQNCNSLTNVVIANGVTSLGQFAFYGCGGLTSVILPPSLTYIGNNAYSACLNLTNVVIPSSVTSIGYGLFAQSSNLISVLFLGNPPTIVQSNNQPVFVGDPFATVYYLPGATEWGTNYAGVAAEPISITAPSHFTYTTNGGAITITSYAGNSTMVIMPSVINGLPVTSIGTGAFISNNVVTVVAVSTNLTTIEDNAFAYCANLNNITLSPVLTIIANGAFQGCIGLLGVSLPNSLVTIGNNAFAGCFEMLTIDFPASLANIGNGAFASCSNLANLYFFGSPPSLGSGAFGNDPDITAIDYSPSATNWGPTLAGIPTVEETPVNQFVYTVNSGNESITITGYTGLGGIVAIPPSINGLTVSGTTFLAFYGNTSLKSVSIPDSITSLGGFYGCGGLTNVNLGHGITSLGFEEFANCTSLGSITVPTNVTAITGGNDEGSYVYGSAFQSCTGLTNLVILGSPVIGEYTFSQLPLQSAYIAGGNIGGFAFAFCNGLTNLTLGDSVTNISGCAFVGDQLGSVIVPGSVTTIGGDAFDSCGLTNLILSNGVVSIGGLAFAQNALTTLTFPSSVTSIGTQVVIDCGALTNIVVEGGVAGEMDNTTFQGCGSLRSVLFMGDASEIVNSENGPLYCCTTNVVTYYLPGTSGWTNPFQDNQAVLWNPAIQTSGPHFGVAQGQFGFDITGTSNDPVQLQICTNLSSQAWTPLTNVSLSNGLYHYSQPIQSNSANRFYRIVFP
jgi:hypothetical protein